MPLKFTVIKSTSLDPFYNLALEECLFNNLKEGEFLLFIYVNESSVIIGRNQNPWVECDVEFIRESGIHLVRRFSGGGTVFHDSGNINASFIVNKPDYDVHKQLSALVDAVNGFGIPAKINDRNDIIADNHKFSGSAFCFRKNKAVHHATLMVSVDLSTLSSSLKSKYAPMIDTRSIKSVRSSVVNLNSYSTFINVESLKDSIVKSIKKIYNFKESIISSDSDFLDNILEIKSVYDNIRSCSWVYGETPQFNFILNKCFEWGSLKISVKADKSKITGIEPVIDIKEFSLQTMVYDYLNYYFFCEKENYSGAQNYLSSLKNQYSVIAEVDTWLNNEEILNNLLFKRRQ